MAGVGFAMCRLVDRGGLLGPGAALGYATLLAAGPYLASSLAIVTLGVASAPEDGRVGLALAAYATAFSMLGFGPFQFAAARVLGDLLHEQRLDAFSAVLAQLLGPLLVGLFAVGTVFLTQVPMPVPAKVAAMGLYLALGGTWLAMVPLSAAQGYRAIAALFVGGVGLGCLLALGLGRLYGLSGLLAGLAIGQGLVLIGLVHRADREFGPVGAPLADLWARLARYRPLMVAGACYAGGLWVDKLIFWFHPAGPGMAVAGPLRVCPPYDNGMSLAALSTIPALALFVLLAETDLASRVKDYFATLEARAGLASVEEARRALVSAVHRNLGLLALVQGTITAGVVIFSPEIVQALQLPWLSVFIFRIGAVGALFQVLFMAALVHLLYLDLTRQAAGLAALFFLANALFTLMAMGGGLPAYGFGFAAAGALALGATLLVLDDALGDLEYHVFMKQPL